MSEPWVILETSGRGGRVGLAAGGRVAAEVALDPARRHARDLMPAVSRLLADAGLTPAALHGVMVSVGPGSFTGLRVGVMTAKALAWATGCRLVAVPTFLPIAGQTPEQADTVDVVSDALQGLVYAQRFRRTADGWAAADQLRIEAAADWAARLTADVWVSGPGLAACDGHVPAVVPRVAEAARLPGVEALFRVGLRTPPATRDELLRLEPLYLRGSSAEEKAARGGR